MYDKHNASTNYAHSARLDVLLNYIGLCFIPHVVQYLPCSTVYVSINTTLWKLTATWNRRLLLSRMQ
ncbi:hypothetical protein XENTR_v10000857 [Xenopus tropicalis]|nr:hypothetical protein XENTR_v10000857 [Xenopus tropicalis]